MPQNTVARTAALKKINSTQARGKFSDLLDAAQRGDGHLIMRNEKPVAAIVTPDVALLAPIVRAVLNDLGESLEMSEDPDIVAAVKRGMEEIGRGRVVTYEV
jgi:antitoxin (DNA-binding transcriptional repressor) of toxin-antitoxin stability system